MAVVAVERVRPSGLVGAVRGGDEDAQNRFDSLWIDGGCIANG